MISLEETVKAICLYICSYLKLEKIKIRKTD